LSPACISLPADLQLVDLEGHHHLHPILEQASATHGHTPQQLRVLMKQGLHRHDAIAALLLEKGEQEHALLRAFTYAGKRPGTVVNLWVQNCPNLPEVGVRGWVGRGRLLDVVCWGLAGRGRGDGGCVLASLHPMPESGNGVSLCLITRCGARCSNSHQADLAHAVVLFFMSCCDLSSCRLDVVCRHVQVLKRAHRRNAEMEVIVNQLIAASGGQIDRARVSLKLSGWRLAPS
jgi:hypothetical protein